MCGRRWYVGRRREAEGGVYSRGLTVSGKVCQAAGLVVGS